MVYCFLVFRRFWEYISLDMFYFVSRNSSCSVTHSMGISVLVVTWATFSVLVMTMEISAGSGCYAGNLSRGHYKISALVMMLVARMEIISVLVMTLATLITVVKSNEGWDPSPSRDAGTSRNSVLATLSHGRDAGNLGTGHHCSHGRDAGNLIPGRKATSDMTSALFRHD